MDNIAHTLVGAALGRAIADRHVPRAALIGAVAANMPDWAELFMGYWEWTPADRLIEHRGITHSLLGAAIEIPVLILIIGFIARVWSRRRGRGHIPPWGWLAICVVVTFLSHLYMDWQGSYGWRPFLPWSTHWYYLDWVAIVDPFFWLLPLIALAWGSERHWLPLSGVLAAGLPTTILMIWRRDLVAPWVMTLYASLGVVGIVGWIRYWFGPIARQRIATLGLLLLLAYTGAQAIVARTRMREIRQTAERRFGSRASWAALTDVGRPFTWEAIYADSDTVAGGDWQLPRHLHNPAVARAIHDTREGQAIAQFARFLTAEIDTASDTIYLRDARFSRTARRGWAVAAVRMK